MNENVILDHAIAALAPLGLKAQQQKRPAHKPEADAWLRLEKDKQHIDFVVEIRRTVQPATLGAVVARLRRLAAEAGREPLLITTHVTPPMAEQLRALNQAFADTAGNAHVNGPGLTVLVMGRKPEKQPAAVRAEGKAFTTAGLKVVFALICDADLVKAPHRAIAAAANVALGVVPAVFADLHKLGFVAAYGRKRALHPNRRLLDHWAVAYARTLRPKTLVRKVVPDPFDGWKTWNPGAFGGQWGGEAGGALLTNYLRPGEITLYADKVPGLWMAQHKMRTPVAGGATRYLELRRPFWGQTLKHPEGVPTDVVPPALVYADLLATGDGRCIETAELVYETHLARFFPAH